MPVIVHKEGEPLPDGHPFKGGAIILDQKQRKLFEEHFKKKEQKSDETNSPKDI